MTEQPDNERGEPTDLPPPRPGESPRRWKGWISSDDPLRRTTILKIEAAAAFSSELLRILEEEEDSSAEPS